MGGSCSRSRQRSGTYAAGQAGRNRLNIVRLASFLTLVTLIASSLFVLPACKPQPKSPTGVPPVSSPKPTSTSEPSLQTEPAKINTFCFARDYSVEEILNRPDMAASFEREYIRQEANFFALARNPSGMLTYDGWNLDKQSGIPVAVRYWSAPSKESLDIAICIKTIAGDKAAQLLVADGDAEKAVSTTLQILRGKLESYNSFCQRYPGYGGFLPWFLAGDEMEPTDDWRGELPGLDNGEWVWAMLTAENVLRQQGYQALADEYSRYNQKLKENAARIFFDKSALKVRGDVKVTEPASTSSSYETILSKPGRATYLTGEHGIHEGFMMVMFVTLFSKGLSQAEKDAVWNDIDMVRVEHKYGTTWQVYWGSAHESWAWLFLPFRDLPEYRQLFRLREIIRSNDARERGFPGFPSSTNKPGDSGYISDAGIQGVGTQECRDNNVFAVYGAFPLLLEFSKTTDNTTRNIGLAWLLNMLQAPKMQGPLGGGESSMHDGSAVSYVKTIDGTFPILLAFMGGIDIETAAMMRDSGVYGDFIGIIRQKYQKAFGAEALKELVGFAMPGSAMPKDSRPEYNYSGESYKVRHFDLKFRKAITPLLQAYGWTNKVGTIEGGDVSYFYEHYDGLWELEQYLVTQTGKQLHLNPPPPTLTNSPLPPSGGRPSVSLLSNWKLGIEGCVGWGSDGAKRAPDGTIHIPGRGWTGEMVEPPVSIDGRSYIGIKGKGEFLLEVKNLADRAFIPKVRVRLSPGQMAYVDIPSNSRNDRIAVIAITDYTQDVTIEDIFIADSKE